MISKMFASLKNKIKEETGNDVSRRFPIRPRSPRQGSVSSVTSDSIDSKHFSIGDSISGEEKVYSSNGALQKERELLIRIDQLEREHAQMLEKRERQHVMQLEEKDREWQEKITSLQNNMQAAQAVWSGEAAAARREAREETRRAASLVEQLATATAAAARVQDRLDGLMEEIETERRGWALERIRLATAAEDALHRLSLVEAPTIDDNDSSEMSARENALRRKLEEAQLHLHDIKTSWSGQIAALETQVGRLSRQAGEEGAERRRIEKDRDSILERLREREIQLEQAQATLEDKEAKMALLAAEVGDVARAGREARNEAIRRRNTADSLANNLSQVEQRLTTCQEQCDSLKEENGNLKQSLFCENSTVSTLKKELENFSFEKKQWCEQEQKMNDEINQEKILRKNAESALESESNNCQDASKRIEVMKEQSELLKRELNEIHDRYDKERRDKDEALMRNAHMSQTLEIYRQEMRQQDVEAIDLKEKIAQLQQSLDENLEEQNSLLNLRDQEQQRQSEMETLKTERDNAITSEKQLQECMKDLNSQIAEKSKNVRVLQNRLADMRKTLQRELRGGQVDPLGSSVVEGSAEDPDVSKKYLKHVLIKFLTSREIEARQLTKAVGALLGLSEQEESLLRDTLGWRSGFTAWLGPTQRFPHS